MPSVKTIYIILFLYICCSSMLIIDAFTITPYTNSNNLRKLLLRQKNIPSSIKSNSNLMDRSEALSLLFSDIKRRSVIMPRICYYARVPGTGARQKLCLPYNDNVQP